MVGGKPLPRVRRYVTLVKNLVVPFADINWVLAAFPYVVFTWKILEHFQGEKFQKLPETMA